MRDVELRKVRSGGKGTVKVQITKVQITIGDFAKYMAEHYIRAICDGAAKQPLAQRRNCLRKFLFADLSKERSDMED